MKRPGNKYVLFFLDGVLINTAFLVSIRIHTELTGAVWLYSSSALIPEILFWLACSLIPMFVFITRDLYKIDVYLSVTKQVQSLFKAMTVSGIAIAVIGYFGKSSLFSTSKLVLVSFIVLSIGFLMVGRLLIFREFFRYLRRNRLLHRRAVVVGAGATGAHLSQVLSEPNPFAIDLVGIVDDCKEVRTESLKGVPVFRTGGDLRRLTEQYRIDEIIVCVEGESDDEVLRLLEQCEATRARVLVGTPEYHVISDYSIQERYDGVPMFGVGNGLGYFGCPSLKRLFDLAGASIGVIILLPVLAAVALAVRLDSPGPVFFRQTRIGLNGRPFTFFKFRSMRLGSDQDSNRMQECVNFIKNGSSQSAGSTKIVNEQNVTAVGRLLRKTSLDELPQLFNVIRGDMSLVGPRPCLPYEWNQYAGWQKRRLSVLPGCTGLWQVVARSKVNFREMVLLDIFYANNISFHLDAWLVLKTIPVMLFGSGGK